MTTRRLPHPTLTLWLISSSVTLVVVGGVPAGAVLLAALAVGGLLRPWQAPAERARRRRERVQGTLLAVDRATSTGPPPTIWDLVEQAGRWPARYERPLGLLHQTGLIERDGDYLYPTAAGRAAAHAIELQDREHQFDALTRHRGAEANRARLSSRRRGANRAS